MKFSKDYNPNKGVKKVYKKYENIEDLKNAVINEAWAIINKALQGNKVSTKDKLDICKLIIGKDITKEAQKVGKEVNILIYRPNEKPLEVVSRETIEAIPTIDRPVSCVDVSDPMM